MDLSRRRLLKLGGAALGTAAVGPKVTATPAGNRFTLDVGDRVTERDVVAAERSGLEVVRNIEPIGYLSVRGKASDVRALPYDWTEEHRLEFNEPDVNDAAPTVSDVDPEEVVPDESPFDYGPDPDAAHFDPPALYLLQWDKITQFLSRSLLTADGTGRKVAIIDSGVYAGHSDLNVNTAQSMNLTSDSEDSGPWGGDHGTHVAGIAAATGDVNTVGTAPGAEILSYRVFSSIGGFATSSDIAFAIVDSALKGCDAANMSLGFPDLFATRGPSAGVGELIQQLYSDAATFARSEGTVVVNSAGNAETNLDQPGLAPISEAQNIVTVSATGPIGFLWGDGGLAEPFSSPAFYTNYGDAAIDIGAHGGDADLSAIGTGVNWFYDLVLNTVVDTDFSSGTFTENWGWKAGTSMAAPQVTGALALLRDAHPDYTPQDLFDAMAFTSGVADAEGFDPLYHGSGQLRPDRALVADLSEIRTGSGRGPESGRGARSGRGTGRGGTYCEGETRGSSATRCDGSSGAGGGRSGGSGRGKGSGRGNRSGRG